MTSTTDADGRTIDYGYNANGQVASEAWVGGNYTATYEYNADGELTDASDPFSTYNYTYDGQGNVTSVSNAGTPNVPTVTLTYGYDMLSDRTSLTDSLGGSISYSYNADQEMTGQSLSLNGETGPQMTFAYDAGGRLTGITRTGSGSPYDTITSTFTYDQANELTNITDEDTTQNTLLASYTYTYNADGTVASYQDNSGNSLTYGYDGDQELTSATGTLNGSNYTFTYNYDPNGNRTSTSTDVNGNVTSATYTTGTGNELLSDGTYSYTYDKDGNMTSQTDIATGDVTYYTWDYENRLTEVKVENSEGQVLEDEKFTYDMFGNRIAVSLNGSPELYTVYDGANPYIDFNGSGTLTERYLTNPNGLNQFYGQVDSNGNTQWFLTDNIGSIRQVVNASNGNVLDAITYDPYGNIVTQTYSANAPRFLYAGGAYDSITGDYLDGAREDNPVDGRWLNQDPLGFLAGDADLYRYVGNEPIDAIDPSGLHFIVPTPIPINLLYEGKVTFEEWYKSWYFYLNPQETDYSNFQANLANALKQWQIMRAQAQQAQNNRQIYNTSGYIGLFPTPEQQRFTLNRWKEENWLYVCFGPQGATITDPTGFEWQTGMGWTILIAGRPMPGSVTPLPSLPINQVLSGGYGSPSPWKLPSR